MALPVWKSRQWGISQDVFYFHPTVHIGICPKVFPLCFFLLVVVVVGFFFFCFVLFCFVFLPSASFHAGVILIQMNSLPFVDLNFQYENGWTP